MEFHVAKKSAQPNSKQSTVFSSCEQEIPSSCYLQQHRKKEHEAKQRKLNDTVADLNGIVIEGALAKFFATKICNEDEKWET